MTQPPYDGPNSRYPQHAPTYPTPQAGPAPYGPPPQPYGQMPPAPAGYRTDTAKRPGTVTAAAVMAFVTGGLTLLLGLVGLSAFGGLNGFSGLLFVLVLVVAAAEIWGGIQLLNGKDARILTVAAGAGIVLSLLSLIGAFQGRSLLSFVIPGLILYFLLSAPAKAWFDQVGVKHF